MRTRPKIQLDESSKRQRERERVYSRTRLAARNNVFPLRNLLAPRCLRVCTYTSRIRIIRPSSFFIEKTPTGEVNRHTSEREIHGRRWISFYRPSEAEKATRRIAGRKIKRLGRRHRPIDTSSPCNGGRTLHRRRSSKARAGRKRERARRDPANVSLRRYRRGDDIRVRWEDGGAVVEKKGGRGVAL